MIAVRTPAPASKFQLMAVNPDTVSAMIVCRFARGASVRVNAEYPLATSGCSARRVGRIAWPAAIVFCVVWLVIAGLTRYSSLAALIASAS